MVKVAQRDDFVILQWVTTPSRDVTSAPSQRHEARRVVYLFAFHLHVVKLSCIALAASDHTGDQKMPTLPQDFALNDSDEGMPTLLGQEKQRQEGQTIKKESGG